MKENNNPQAQVSETETTEKSHPETQIIIYGESKHNWLQSILMVVLIIAVLLSSRCCCHCRCDCHGDSCHSCTTQTPTEPSPTKPSASIGTVTDPDVPDVDPNAGDYVKPTTPENDGVAIPGWGKLTIPANAKKDIVVDFFNPDANAEKYYLTFELRIPAENEKGYEVLYKSGLIAPGQHIQKIDLNRGVPAGTYNAILHVQPYRMEDKSLTNNADLKLELVAK